MGTTHNDTLSADDGRRSIEIISRMIVDTQAHIDRESGKYFLLWGYTTVVVSLAEYFAQVFGIDTTLCLYGWYLIPLVGGVGMLLLARSRSRSAIPRPKSYIDRCINAVWSVFGLSYIMAFIAALVYGVSILYLTVLLMGMGTVITGLVCRHRVLTLSGIAGMLLSLLFPARHLLFRDMGPAILDISISPIEFVLYIDIAIFALIFIVMMVVPGHILLHRAKRRGNA